MILDEVHTMTLDPSVVIVAIGVLVQLGISFIKPRYIGFIPPVISCIVFVCTRELNLLYLAYYQSIILGVTILVTYIMDKVYGKKKSKDVDKSKIKDL